MTLVNACRGILLSSGLFALEGTLDGWLSVSMLESGNPN
jgi:hypothetical protein